MEAHLRRIERVNPRVNAIVTLVAERALRRRAPPTGAGAAARRSARCTACRSPHKDLFDTAGIRTTFGSPIFRDHVPDARTR